jgi:hypothetical protein
MKTKRILLLVTILLVITASVSAQSTQVIGQHPVKIITDTNFLKNGLHLQSWGDTSMMLKFIIWHDTLYLFMLHSEMKLPEKSFPGGKLPEYAEESILFNELTPAFGFPLYWCERRIKVGEWVHAS